MSVSLKGQRFTLEEFKSFSPDDLSPAAFLQWTDGTLKDKEKLHLAYVSLFSQAKKSHIPETQKDGKTMERMWKDRGTSLDSYWTAKTLKKLRSKNVIAAARNSSALQIAVGDQQFKDALRELQGQQEQRSQEQPSTQTQEQEQEQKRGHGTSTAVLLENELNSDSMDSDFQPSISTSARTLLSSADFRYRNNLTGPGETSCRLTTKFKYVIGGLDVSQLLMAARREMVKQQCTLKSTADLLSLNFIFTKTFLEDCLPREIASRLSQQPVANPGSEDIDLLLSCCLNVGSADYQQGRAFIKERAARRDSIAGDIISAYASSGVLRDNASKLAINENTYIEQSVKPFITGTFVQLDFQEHWTIDPFPVPTDYEERLYADFFAEKDGLPFAVLEVKSPDADPDECGVDIRKMFLLMKLSLNCLLDAGVEDPVILGMLVQDRRCEVFSMDIAYEAIYIPKAIGTFEIPENKLQLPLLLHALGPLTTAREIASNTLTKITSRSRRRTRVMKSLLTRPSFYLHGVHIPEPLAPAVAL
ncbi:hypothetical protein BG004_005918 [Podila humilis]|nr:hypothetical protein BG004_005918 [Podila humilis]